MTDEERKVQEQQSQQSKKKFSLENLKKTDIKKVVKVFTLLWGLILIVLMTITNVGIDKEFNWLTWVSNSLIIFGIMVFGLLMGETSGKDKQMEKPNGLFQRTLNKYEKYNESITEELVYFNQFYTWLLPQEIERKKVDYLIVMGVDANKAEKIVKYCTKKDLEEIKKHTTEITTDDGRKILIRQLEEHEIDPVTDVLSGVIKLNAANANYFLTAFADSKVNDRIVEEGNTLQKERKRNRTTNRVVKIVSSLAVSLIWGLLTVYDFISGNDTQAWVNLVSRVTALFTSFFSGWGSSVIDIKIQARILENKFKVLQMFHNCLVKKMFKPKLEEELAREEYEAYLKEKAEAVKNVVEPEVIVPKTPEIEQKQEKKDNIDDLIGKGELILL